MKRCICCKEEINSFDLRYTSLEIKGKLICTGCAEALTYIFLKECFNKHLPDFKDKQYAKEMQRRLKIR